MKDQSDQEDATRTSMASTKADLRELKENSNATVRELQEFLRQLKGKSPQEMLGVVASSQLIRATILSVILVTTALFALTAIPYFLGDKAAKTADTTSVEPAPAPPEPTPPAPGPEAPSTDPPDPIAPLGVNDKIIAPSNTNPLEDKGEDFLKDLE